MSRGAADTFEFVTHRTGPREFIAMGIPTFGTVNIFWASRVFGMLRHPMNRVLRHYMILGNEVGLARNEIVAKALQVEVDNPDMRCSHVFFVDDDVLVHPEALLKLLADERPIVGGLYFAKSAVPQALVLMEEGVERKWRPGEIVDCWAHGMGLTLIDADVFRRLRDETDLGVDVNGNPNWFATIRDVHLVAKDGRPVIGNQTEDVTFLRKAAALGYQPCVDTSPQTFGFHWAAAERRAYPVRQWMEFQEKGTITWTDTPDGQPVVWSEEAA
jgi:hypothetical protein